MQEVTKTVTRLFLEANFNLTDDVLDALKTAQKQKSLRQGKRY